jgi:hypothetical protein
MIIGDKSTFAIEYQITTAYARLSLRALGFFVIYVANNCYGVCSPDATMLACSYEEVQDRIARRGNHTAPFANQSAPEAIADAIYRAIYAPDQEEQYYFGMLQSEFEDFVVSSHLLWAPDGDEAFDDGSFIIHFDVGDRVRLIAFKSGPDFHHLSGSLRDIWLPAEYFYRILQLWRDDFDAEWSARPQTSGDEFNAD